MSDLNLKDSINTSLKEIQEREPEAEEKPEVEQPVEVEEPEETEEKEQPEETEEAPEPEAAEPAPQEPEDRSIVNPPSTWTAKAKSMWKDMHPELRKEVLRREGNIRKGIEQYKEKAEFGNRLERTISPYRAFLNAKGANVEKVVEDALNLAYLLDSSAPDKKALVLRQIAQQYGADLRVLTQQPNPEQDRLNQLLSPLQQEIEALKRERQYSLYEQEQQNNSQLQKMIEEFETATDDTGRLKHPYYPELRDVMASLLETGRVSTLEDAYNFAAQADPEISKLVRPMTTKSISDEAKARADKARRNNQVAPSKKPLSISAGEKAGSMRDTISQKLKELRAST
jgi:hypothetical protein